MNDRPERGESPERGPRRPRGGAGQGGPRNHRRPFDGGRDGRRDDRDGERRPRRGDDGERRRDERGERPRRDDRGYQRRDDRGDRPQRDDRGAQRRDDRDGRSRRDGRGDQRRTDRDDRGYQRRSDRDDRPRWDDRGFRRRDDRDGRPQRDDRGVRGRDDRGDRPRRDDRDRRPERGDRGERPRHDGGPREPYGRGGTRGGGRSDRGGRGREYTEAERLQHELRPVRSEHRDPVVPDDVRAKDLHPAARNELKTLQADVQDRVARHLAMVALLIDDDPALAHQHALSAARRAGRIPVTRETLAVTAYRTGDFALALRELRTYRRLSGLDVHVALMVDCERGLGRPEKALETGLAADPAALDTEQRVQLAIAMSGARLDLGQTQQALFELEIPELNPSRAFSWSPELFGAYAAVLEDLGRDAEAAEWFRRADQAAAALQEHLGGLDELEVFEVFETEPVPAEPEAEADDAASAPSDGGDSGPDAAAPPEPSDGEDSGPDAEAAAEEPGSAETEEAEPSARDAGDGPRAATGGDA